MNFLKMFFKKKDKKEQDSYYIPEIKMKTVEISKDPYELPKSINDKYLFSKTCTTHNIKRIIKYWEENIDSFREQGDYIEYNGIHIKLKTISMFSSQFTDIFFMYLYPQNDDFFHFYFNNEDDKTGMYNCDLRPSTRLYKNKSVILKSDYDTKEKVYEFLYNLTLYGVIKKSEKAYLQEYFDNVGLSGKNIVDYMSVNNGEYYIISEKPNYINSVEYLTFGNLKSHTYDKDMYSYKIYKFDTWEYVPMSFKTLLEVWGESPVFEECEDPKKTHWQHFLKLECAKKEKYLNELKEFVESIFNMEEEYRQITKESELLIKDYRSFRNFCGLINQTIDSEKYSEVDLRDCIIKVVTERFHQNQLSLL